MEQSLIHGENQQGSMLFLIGWFVGILEGEGHVGLDRNRSYRGKPVYNPRICITNADVDIMNACVQILQQLGIAYHIRQKTRQKERRVCWQIYIWGYKRVYRLLKPMQPFILGEKRILIDRLLIFIERRLQYSYSSTPYTQEEIKLAENIYYKKCISPREHTPTFPYGKKICSELNRDIQRLTEMISPVRKNE
jgi:hypothetical protein